MSLYLGWRRQETLMETLVREKEKVMATKTYCDLCGDECGVKRTGLAFTPGGLLVDLGDTCDTCRAEAVKVVTDFRDEKLKTKKQSIVVDQATADTVAALADGTAKVVLP